MRRRVLARYLYTEARRKSINIGPPGARLSQIQVVEGPSFERIVEVITFKA